MRTRDEQKQDAIFEATVKLINEIGFVAGSISKIAKEAGVSPATIYIYYKNKEDLLVSTYINIKQKIGQAFLKDYDPELPIRDILKKLWYNGFDFVSQNSKYFHFAEQFANSPFASLVNRSEVEKAFEPVFSVIQKGVKQKIIKDVPFEVLSIFIYYPIMTLSNSRIHGDLVITEEIVEAAFNMAWDAIRL
jgi:AcrR family transcriptional regulator